LRDARHKNIIKGRGGGRKSRNKKKKIKKNHLKSKRKTKPLVLILVLVAAVLPTNKREESTNPHPDQYINKRPPGHSIVPAWLLLLLDKTGETMYLWRKPPSYDHCVIGGVATLEFMKRELQCCHGRAFWAQI
jgi:hypothetical protein